MITAIALDDERPALDIIQTFCDRIDGIDLVKTFTRTGEARQYMADKPVDLIFLDINMPNESGLSFSMSVPPPTLVVFTTAYSEYAVESYELEAVDYLLKPFSFERFAKSVQRAQTRWQARQPATDERADKPDPAHLYVRVDYGLVRIAMADIQYIEGLDNYLKIHVLTGKPVVVRLTMKAILEKLPAGQFVRVHRSFIVAVDKMQRVRNRMLLIGTVELPIGSSYETEFFTRFGT